ncbi:MAG: dihydrolipoyllysine-residue succinyltransferase [Chlamydiia bacterium]|nr:dihydrolipoyllysine-residue succinyltransferase [Chlamydiia bacterium]
MTVELKIPAMGESVVEVTIGTIFKPSGSSVALDEEILEIETDKVNQVLTAQASGTLHLTVKTGDQVKVGAPIGRIEEGAKASTPTPAPSLKKEEIPSVKSALPPSLSTLPPVRKGVDASIEERRAVDEKKSVAKHVQKEPERAGERRERMSNLRRVIAERLVKVKNETAMLTTFNEVDMSAVMAVREKEQEAFQKRHGIKLGFMSFFVKAAVAALEEFPVIGARIEKEEIVFPEKANIGVAVSTERGLMVPVIQKAKDLSFAEIEKQLKQFAEAARKGTLSIDAMQGGTFTITNGGVFGSLLSTPILNPPQSGILGMHTIQERPVAIKGHIAIRPMMYLAVSYDHRIVDGKDAIQFLSHIKQSLEEPTRLLLDL